MGTGETTQGRRRRGEGLPWQHVTTPLMSWGGVRVAIGVGAWERHGQGEAAIRSLDMAMGQG
jgi:hypothetical protein